MRSVVVGDVVTVAAAHRTAVLRVLGLGTRRGPAEEARCLYQDLAAPDSPAVETS